MKTLRMIAAIILLFLVFSGASADSIFPVLTPIPTAAPTAAPAAPVLAPSYGMMANVEADEVTENTQGGTVVTYRNVSTDGFNTFGEYLGGRGFSVTDTETRDGLTAYALSDGRTSFVLFYDAYGQVMTLVYPQGTAYEQPRFPGYQTLSIGEEIQVTGLGRFTFVDFHLNEKIAMAGMIDRIFGETDYYDINGDLIVLGNKTKPVYTYFGFKAFNTTDRDLQFCANKNEVMTMTLHYVNADGKYSYEQSTPARYSSKNKMFVNGYKKSLDSITYMSRPLPSMTDDYLYSIFEVPSGVRDSTDGTMYVAIEFATGDRVVIVLRENGVDCYEKPAG
ncbi:MAG: hypothetical protein IKI84_09210 [Clostridia bacterium]|nr:hypothetical protein [Clostridia bacterium]